MKRRNWFMNKNTVIILEQLLVHFIALMLKLHSNNTLYRLQGLIFNHAPFLIVKLKFIIQSPSVLV